MTERMLQRADFYLLEKPSFHECLPFAVQLSNKIYAQGHAVRIVSNDPNLHNTLNEMLWTHLADSFIPHEADDGFAITVAALTQTPTIELRLCLTEPLIETSIPRLLQIVPNEAQLKQLAREHYRHYQQHNVTLHTHTIT